MTGPKEIGLIVMSLAFLAPGASCKQNKTGQKASPKATKTTMAAMAPPARPVTKPARRKQLCAKPRLPKLGSDDLIVSKLFARKPSGYSTEVAVLRLDPASRRYRADKRLTLKEFSALHHSRCGLIASSEHGLKRLGPDFRVERKRALDISVSAIASDQFGYTYLSAGGVFHVLDRELRTVGKLKIICQGKQKDAHYIAIHGEHAYLLDNRASPICILRVRITHPSRPLVEANVGFRKASAFLSNIVLFPDRDVWMMRWYGGGRGNWHERLIAVSMKKPAGKRLFDKVIRRPDNKTSKEWTGYSLERVFSLPPAWAIISQDERKYDLARLEVSRTGFELKQRTTLVQLPPKPTDAAALSKLREQPVLLARRGKRIYAVLPDEHLHVVDTGTKPMRHTKHPLQIKPAKFLQVLMAY